MILNNSIIELKCGVGVLVVLTDRQLCVLTFDSTIRALWPRNFKVFVEDTLASTFRVSRTRLAGELTVSFGVPSECASAQVIVDLSCV